MKHFSGFLRPSLSL